MFIFYFQTVVGRKNCDFEDGGTCCNAYRETKYYCLQIKTAQWHEDLETQPIREAKKTTKMQKSRFKAWLDPWEKKLHQRNK